MAKDLTQMSFASWLEEILGAMAKEEPSAIAICMRCKDGNVMTGYYDCTPEEKANMAFEIQTDAMWDVILASADQIVRRAEEMEQDEEESDT